MNYTVRPFRRADRDQLTGLVNRHVEVVMPGGSVPVNTVLSQLEREPGEFIVDPWVAERVTLVAEQADNIVAAALLHRYLADPHVPETYRGAGEIRWLLFAPIAPHGNPHWHDGNDAGNGLMQACLKQLNEWSCTTIHAGNSLPAPGVYGVPDQWRHIAVLYRRSGFEPTRLEVVHLVSVETVTSGKASLSGLTLRRSVGINGTRFTASRDDNELGFIEVERLTGTDRHSGPVVADIGNLSIAETHQRQGIGTSLLRHAAEWLRFGRVDTLLAYSSPNDPSYDFLRRNGFVALTTTKCGWTKRHP